MATKTPSYLEQFKISNPFLVGLFSTSSKCKFGGNNQRFRSNLIAKIV